jgi:hypothetical protein
MCLSENEPGGPRRCDGHAESGYTEAVAKLGATISEQGDISRQLQPVESELIRHRALAEAARANGNKEVAAHALARIDRIEESAEPLRAKAKKLSSAKASQLQALAEKREEFHATSTGLLALQKEIDLYRIKAKDESLPLPEREFARLESGRLASIAGKAKLRMDSEELNRLENARKNGWDYQVKEVIPIASYATKDETPRVATGDHKDYYHAVNQLAADRGVTMYAQGTLSDPDATEYDKYHVVVGNEEGKTVTIDFANYALPPVRDPNEPLEAMHRAPSRGEVYEALNRRYAAQRAEPSFDKQIGGKGFIDSKDDPKYAELKESWQSSARERARLKKVLGEERFEKLATL